MGRKHDGRTHHPLYKTWESMVLRCRCRGARNYYNYGGRGIEVCDRWLGEQWFWNFVKDMGNKPDGYSLDRINPNGNYTPENCRWANGYTQQSNRRIKSNTGIVGVSKMSSGQGYLAEVGGRKTRVRKMFKTLEQAKSWRDIKLKERIVGK